MADVSGLSQFIDQATHESRLRVESDLGDGFVRLRVSEAERRQAKQDIRCVEDAAIEMLRNARDAHARSIFFAASKSGSIRRFTMVDDGDGVPEHLHETVFEPRVTSKLDSLTMDDWGVHGRGMALYSIKANAEEAFIASSAAGQGSSFVVTFDTTKVTERRDQSTLPDLVKALDGVWSVGSSPHNIARTVAEFALANRKKCTVYFGSPVEIAATLLAFGRSSHQSAGMVSFEQVAPSKRLACASDSQQFAHIAADIGLEMSSRSAHRILQGQIKPLPPYLESLSRRREGDTGTRSSKRAVGRDYRGLKVAQEDVDDFLVDLKRAWRELADRYFLEGDVEPAIRISHDSVHVTFPVRKQL